ncbi:hypothetical protein HDV05_006611 [Chytridiales sp. JEL 0842]|nr:hypothetical protein HDV05_006611 [Chytridiales sp. JEL 0842]
MERSLNAVLDSMYATPPCCLPYHLLLAPTTASSSSLKLSSISASQSASPDIKGFLLSDPSGLCISARGKASPPSTAGTLTSISRRGSALASIVSDKKMEGVSVVIESEQGNLVVHGETGGMVLAVFS